jgi:hypothetical protein
MLLPVALNPSSGFDTFLGNVAALQNKGFELEYDYSLFKKTEFVSIYGNFYKTEVKLQI